MNKSSASSATLPTGNQSTSRRYAGVVVAPRYSSVSGRLRRYTSGAIQCSLFCGGSKCKYENESKWTEKDVAIPGLYSHWITDEVLAMARPSTMLIKDRDLIGEFKRVGIQSVFNLQQPGEHKNCGPGIEESSGFSYLPENLMSEGLFFYNYGWEDYGVPSIVNLLDMVKVFRFAVDQGKVAVHCHAGLGRTGVLIACYLIFSQHITTDEAVCHVRSKRPGSIQSPAQLQVVEHFYHFLRPKWIVFPLLNGYCVCREDGMESMSLEQFMSNQRCILHGGDYRCFKYQPKIMCDICGRILDLCGVTTQFPWRTAVTTDHGDSMLEDLCKTLSELELRAYLGDVPSGSEEGHVIATNNGDDDKELELLLSPSKTTSDKESGLNDNKMANRSLIKHKFIQNDHDLENCLDDANTIATINKIKADINSIQSTDYTGVLSTISDVTVLLCLLLSWLDELKDPILSPDDVANIRKDHMIQLHQSGLVKEKAATLQVLSSTVQELANQISPAEGVQQFVHHLSCSLIGCNRPATPTEATNKRHNDPSLLSPTHSKRTLKHSDSVGTVSDDHIIYTLLLNQQH